jgi:riboflavin kinase/FMN adenylyltransferase
MQVTHGTIQPGSGRAGAAGAAGWALTIGNFDGVHLGHRAMLERLVRKSRELGIPCAVLTFEPHPREFFAPSAAPARLSRLREKLELIAAAGVDRTHVLRFGASLATLPAERFVDEILIAGLRARWLLVGRDFRYGAKRAGDFPALAGQAGASGVEAEAMPDVQAAGARVSSSGVRAALAEGRLEDAARLLGRPYSMSGRVAHGEKLGRTLGFPTANIVLRRKPPIAGIFVIEAELEETRPGEQPRRLRGVASVGRRPTIKADAAPLLEAHLFDWEGDLYGRHLRVTFLAKLRDEEKYDGLAALRAAIARDAAQAKDYFRNHG